MNGLSLIICFDNAEERHELWKGYRFAAIRQISELFNSNLNKYVAPSTDETPYPLRHQIRFHQYNPKKLHRYGLLWKLLNGVIFLCNYKSAPTVGTLQIGRQGIASELFDKKDGDEISATCHFEKRWKRCLPYVIYNQNQVKGPKETIDDGKEKLKIIKFYDFPKEGSDIVDQLNDYYNTRAKPNGLRWFSFTFLTLPV